MRTALGSVRRERGGPGHHLQRRAARQAHLGEGHQDPSAATDRARRADSRAPDGLPAPLRRTCRGRRHARHGAHLLSTARRYGLDQARHRQSALRADVCADRLGNAHPPAPPLLRYGADCGWRRCAHSRRSARSRGAAARRLSRCTARSSRKQTSAPQARSLATCHPFLLVSYWPTARLTCPR